MLFFPTKKLCMKKDKESFLKDQDEINNIPKMKKNEVLQNEIHFALSRNPISHLREKKTHTRLGKYMKIFSYLVLFTGIGIVFNSCVGGYVASEPSYIEYQRPQRPSEAHIWINGDWGWNNQTHVYVQKTGYWERPRQGQSYVEGHWQTTDRGKSWSKGHWQKQNQQRNNQRNNNRNNRKW
jgi:hypothetical protein